MIDRDTLWRQGSLLKAEEINNLGVELGEYSRVVVISHDCDLPQETEEYVELIVCKQVTVDKNFTCAKNVRRLHLKFTEGDTEFYLELSYQQRLIVKKSEFSSLLSGPDTNISLDDVEKRTLKQWLTSRYGRPAYPNAFENRLRRNKGKLTIEKHIAKLVEKKIEHITGLFIGLDGDKAKELPDGEPYCLSIFIVYNAEEGAAASRKEAEALASQISSLLIETYGPPDEADEICLEACEAVADSRITLADLMKVDQWRLEWVSLNDSRDDYLPTGHS